MIRFAALAAAALILSAGAASAQSAQGAAASGTVKLNGTVSLNCTVAVTDLGTSLNLTAGGNNVQVGTVTESCNDGAGYTINVTSANGGKLSSAAANSQPISYTTLYDGASASGNVAVTRSSANFGKVASLNVTVPAAAQAIAGTYSDTLTIAIAAK